MFLIGTNSHMYQSNTTRRAQENTSKTLRQTPRNTNPTSHQNKHRSSDVRQIPQSPLAAAHLDDALISTKLLKL